jgi:hypothetical protein
MIRWPLVGVKWEHRETGLGWKIDNRQHLLSAYCGQAGAKTFTSINSLALHDNILQVLQKWILAQKS